MKSIWMILFSLFTIHFISGCGDNNKKVPIQTKEKILVKTEIAVQKPWIRPGVQGGNTAVFFILENKSDKADTLVGASSSLAEVVEVHETYEDDEGKMGMRHTEEIEIKANSDFVFKPMSYHVMLIGLTKDLPSGTEESISIKLKNFGEITFNALVTDNARF